MKVTEEFAVRNASGKTYGIERIAPQRTYLDFGTTKLPRDFDGYRVSGTDMVATPQPDGAFKLKDYEDVFKRV